MASENDAHRIIESTLRVSVLPGVGVRVRGVSDSDLALDIITALDAEGFEIVRKPPANLR